MMERLMSTLDDSFLTIQYVPLVSSFPFLSDHTFFCFLLLLFKIQDKFLRLIVTFFSKPDVDHNCNGIYGVNPKTGKPWEDELCAGTNPVGSAILGDSAGTFHISNAQPLTF
jgi:hypothetical protein